MEREARQQRTRTTTPQRSEAEAEVLASNPLQSVWGWVADLGRFGVGFALMAAAYRLSTDGDTQAFVTALPMFAGFGLILGGASGLLGGATLRALRGRIPAALGLLLASVSSSLPYLLILVSSGNGAKVWSIIPLWGAVVAGLVPVAAVRRQQGRGTGWVSLLFGIGVGALVWAARLLLAG